MKSIIFNVFTFICLSLVILVLNILRTPETRGEMLFVWTTISGDTRFELNNQRCKSSPGFKLTLKITQC